MSLQESSPEHERLAEELRDAFGLGPDASGFEVDLSAPGSGKSSARFTGFSRRTHHRRGTLLGDFEVLDELGRGGMGVVYRARQISLGREVALKVLPDYTQRGPMAIQRFRNEARAAARLQHTHIVPIYAQGEHDGTFFYAMELIEGASLDSAIRERTRLLSPSNPALSATPTALRRSDATAETAALTEEAAAPDTSATRETSAIVDPRALRRTRADYRHLARLLAGVADGLEHAHAAGVVHRDIKPQNLLVGVDEHLHITDFGLARLADAPQITLSGEVMGTPAYLSPEQARADLGAIDGRTDIYSLGVTLYELLTLRRPFQGETREQILTGIKELEPATPRSLDEHIPRDLQTICLKAMEKNPARRYATAAAMAEDLRRFADQRPILSRPAGPITKAVKWCRRHKAASTAMAAACLVLILAAGLAVSVTRGRRASATSKIDDVRERLVFYNYRANDDQLNTLDEAEKLGGDPVAITRLRALAALFDPTDRTRRAEALDLLNEPAADATADADGLYLLALALDRNGEPARSDARIAEADALGDATAEGWLYRGLALRFRDAEEAIRSYEEANRLRAADDEIFLQAMLLLASARNQRMYAARTIDDLGAIVRPLEQIVEFDIHGAYPHNLLSIAHRLAAEVYTGSAGARDADKLAAEHFAQAIAWAQAGQKADPDDALPYFAEMMALQSQGNLAAALAVLNRAEPVAAQRDVRLHELLHYRWRLHWWLGNTEAALADLERYAEFAPQRTAYVVDVFRALVLADAGRSAEAVALAQAIADPGQTGDGAEALRVIWSVTTLRLIGANDSAVEALADLPDDLTLTPGEIVAQSPEWIDQLYRMVRGEASVEALRALAETADQPWRLVGEAEFHHAAARLAAGERKPAGEGFERAWRAYDSQSRYTYFGELISRRMALDPAWNPAIEP
jgi:serine/threonine protein kinase